MLVGSATVASRSVVDQAGPVPLALLRYAIGVCFLLVPTLRARRVRFAPRDALVVGLLGIGQFGILVVLLNWSLLSIPSSRAALLFATMPLLTLLLGAALGTEPIGAPKLLGVLTTIVGVGFAVAEQPAPGAPVGDEWLGEMAALSSALVGAVCSVLYRPYLRRYATLQVSTFAMLASVGFLALLAFAEGTFASPPHLDSAGWLAIVFVGLSSGVGYYLWLWALGRATPTKVTVFLALGPVTATVLGALLLAEPVTVQALVGLGCVVFGVWLAHRRGPGAGRPI